MLGFLTPNFFPYFIATSNSQKNKKYKLQKGEKRHILFQPHRSLYAVVAQLKNCPLGVNTTIELNTT